MSLREALTTLANLKHLSLTLSLSSQQVLQPEHSINPSVLCFASKAVRDKWPGVIPSTDSELDPFASRASNRKETRCNCSDTGSDSHDSLDFCEDLPFN